MVYKKMKWNESGFRPPLCTYRLNWARRTSWGWWDDWDDTVLQTQDSKFESWRSEAEHATSRSRRLPTILTPWCIVCDVIGAAYFTNYNAFYLWLTPKPHAWAGDEVWHMTCYGCEMWINVQCQYKKTISICPLIFIKILIWACYTLTTVPVKSWNAVTSYFSVSKIRYLDFA